MDYANKTQEELTQIAKSIKLTICGGPSLAQETVNNLTKELLKVQALITDSNIVTIDSRILRESLN